jgi:hypothetical protein
LYDDTQLATDPFATIDWILCDKDEAEQIVALVKTINAIFQKYGTGLSDAEYISLPEWDSVVREAKTTLNKLPQGDRTKGPPFRRQGQ